VPHILIVDDDALVRDALHQILARAGHDVEDAADGTAALQAYRQRPCDLVITDLVMPNTEGLETIASLRRLDPHLRIIAISGGGRGRADDYLELARKLGANRVLAKPFSGEDILTIVADVLAEPPVEGQGGSGW